MRTRAGIIGAGLLGVALSAHAYTSPYSSMAVAGSAFTNAWDVTPNLVLVDDNTWAGTQQVTSASGQFKFAANGTWDVNWGGNASIFRVPAAGSAPTPGGANLAFSGLSNGLYRFVFNDSTKLFRMEWAGGAPLPRLVVTNLGLVGDFNGWTASGSSVLTNSPANTNLWTCSVNLDLDTAFQFRPNNAADNQWGAPETTTIAASNLFAVAATNTACGKSSYSLSGLVPGTFRFQLDTSNVTFTVTQTATQQPLSSMTVQGSFIATTNPPANMTRVGSTTSWESDHFVTNSGTITLRFASDNNARRWGATNITPVALPASGTLATGLTAYAQVSGVTTGRYRITFDHQTGNYTFRQVYPESAGLNLLKNPGFEQTTGGDAGGDSVDWGGWQAWPKQVSEGYLPHSGKWCGAIHGQFYPDWTDYGSYAQDVLVEEGKTYRASGWFLGYGGWTAAVMQIKMEWLNATNGALGDDAVVLIPALSNAWVRYSAEGTAPAGAAKAHVVFLCSGATTSGKMLVDDVEMRAVAGRVQNFDTWGALTTFTNFAPDWSVTSGKAINNVPPGRPPADLFISQVVEGTGNNKAVEIFNGTLTNVDLAAGTFVLQQYNNGSLTASVSLALSGILPSGDCLVVGRPGLPTNYAPDLAIGGLANLFTNKHLTFNGDDVLVLRSGGAAGTVKDRVGQVSAGASGSLWSRSVKDHTLYRKTTVFTGTVNAVTSAFPLADEWSIAANDTFDDLGVHEISFLDPNEPYTPAGYSLVLNTNATLMSGDLSGGIGEISFWYRTESMTPPVTISIDTAPAEDGPWTTNATLSGLAKSNFTYQVVSLDQPTHLYVRWRQTDGGTNRFRIDEITVSEPSAVKRYEDFAGWTDPSYEVPGSYSRQGWALQNSSIAPTSGLVASRAALLPATTGAILSPAYGDGVGEVIFWTKATEAYLPGTLRLRTRTTDNTNWTTQATFTSSTGNTYSTWLYLTNSGAQAMIDFDPSSAGDVLVDNIEVRAPVLYRDQDFDGWPYKPNYTSGTSRSQGWIVSNSIVDAQYSYEGMAARLRDVTTGTALIQSPYFPDGVGSISYRFRKYATNSTAPSIQVQVSSNASAWTVLATNSPATTNYEQVVIFREDPTNHYVRLVHTAGASAVPIDDIRIGIPQPRPAVAIAVGTDPSAPASNQTVQITADIISRYGAAIVSVTGYYWTASTTSALPMTAVAYGSYASSASIPAQPAGTLVRYYVKVQYSGIGAVPGSSGYTTNITASATNSYQISSVQQGDVWINEFSYLVYDDEFFEEDHEFVELCGRSGTSISNWTIQLAFGGDSDIANNSNQPVYASYKITGGHTFTNQTNGFSFYVLGDQQLLDAGEPVNKVLTTLVPPVVSNWGFNHIQDTRGVIRLLNEYSNLVYSLCYDGYAAGSDRVPAGQEGGGTNAVSLTGTGSSYEDFTPWVATNFSIGRQNYGQTLLQDSNVFATVWHTPSLLVTPDDTNIPAFHMRDPYAAENHEPLWIHYGYPANDYPLPNGILYYRLAGSPVWSNLNMSIRAGSLDSNDNAYVAASFGARAFTRGTAIEYVLQANPNKAGIDTTYIGSDGGDGFTNFPTLAEAKASPFEFTFAIQNPIVITNISTNATAWIFHTAGNDPLEAFTHFRVYRTTNLLVPTHLWTTNYYTNTPIDAFGQNVFFVPKTNLTPTFYRIDVLWP